MSHHRPIQIMVVEDEFLIRLTLVEALGDEGYHVLEAENGDDAVPLLDSNPGVALLLTDIQLPGSLDGRALVAKVRAVRPHLPVVFMTGRPDPADEEVVSPFDRYIAKPYTLAEIARVVRELIGVDQAL